MMPILVMMYFKIQLIILDPTFTERAATWTTEVTQGAQTVGANTSNLSWTYANTAGSLGF